MRIGDEQKIQARFVGSKSTKGLSYAEYVTKAATSLHVGLAGANDPAAIAVRRAQSFLRFDRRPSYFSEIFLLTGNGDEIIYCPLVGADCRKPEGLGIVIGNTSAFADAEQWPNQAIVSFTFPPPKKKDKQAIQPADRVARALKAARDPKAARERYDLWAMTAAWQRYLFEPVRTPNPLMGDTPHPGAAFIRWVLSLAGVETSPSALDELDAPEHLWASANYWYRSYETPEIAAEVSLVRDIRDPAGTVSLPAPPPEPSKATRSARRSGR